MLVLSHAYYNDAVDKTLGHIFHDHAVPSSSCKLFDQAPCTGNYIPYSTVC